MGPTKPYATRMPRNVPTSAAPTLCADGRGVRAFERRHGVHDAEHRRHDAEAGQRIRHFLHGVRGLVRFLVVRLELVFEQALELVRIEVAADDEPQAVRDELDHVMVVEDLRIFLEEGALVGRLEIVLDRHHALFADLHQDVVQQLEECDVVLALDSARLWAGRWRP